MKGPDVLIEMPSLVRRLRLMACYVLFDSWFAYLSTIRRILGLGLHSICMLKDTDSIRYNLREGLLP